MRSPRTRLLIVLLGLIATCLVFASPSPAAPPSPHWSITTLSAPSHFKPGDSADLITLIVTNDGSQPTDGSTVAVADVLPAGITATEITGTDHDANTALECSLGTLSCTDLETPVVAADDYLLITIKVSVGSSLPATLSNKVMVSGGGPPVASTDTPISIDATPAPFGVSSLSTQITDQSGAELTQAGSHPFEMTTSFVLNSSSLDTEGLAGLSASAKDIDVSFPPGLIGNPTRLPKCSQFIFQTLPQFDGCPADTQVGLLKLFFYGSGTASQTVPVYNVEPPASQSVELGFTISSFVHVPMFFKIRSDKDYGLTAELSEIPETNPVRAAIFSLWGIPADPSHDLRRDGLGCSGGCPSEVSPAPFLTLPTSCPGSSPEVGLVTDSWQSPGRRALGGSPDLGDPSWATAASSVGAATGCSSLASHPSITVAPDTAQAGAPSGYTVNIHVPQNEDPGGLATPALKRVAIVLPQGTVISPSGANGLQGCSDDPNSPAGDQFGLHSSLPASCPAASQLGSVRIVSPLLSSPLEGQLFLGKPECEPCSPTDAEAGRMVRLFLQARGSGLIIKLSGSVAVDQSTGQLTTTFDDTPPLPLGELSLTFNGGSRAPLANPSQCGTATTVADLGSWSEPFTPDTTPLDSFQVGGCESPVPFAPSFTAGMTGNHAGGFNAFTVTLTRGDLDQDLGGLLVRPPPGLLGLLAKVPLCGEPQAQEGSCPLQSQIGHATVGAGPGTDPVWVSGQVYLTGPYGGAPFGLSIVVPVKAGPLDLGSEIVRTAIAVDPHTAQLTLLSDPVPTVRDGIPLQVRTVSLTVDREGFMFNPTNCAQLSVSGTIASNQGASVTRSSPFQAADCATLPFKPSLTASTQAKTSRAQGASLDLKIGYPGGAQANLRSVALGIPQQMPSRLTTIQKACRVAVFSTNPATCPAGSDVGSAIVKTPVLRVPLIGPVYLVSRGGRELPSLAIALQGQGVVLDLIGSIGISKRGVLSTKFATVPDAPISSFEVKLPVGTDSALTANLPAKAKGKFCTSKLLMPTVLIGQNGAQIKQSTRVHVTRCSVKHSTKTKKR